MDIDWTQIRGALGRIEAQLSKAQKVIKSSDEAAVQDWPEITREEIEASFPDWRTRYKSRSIPDFLEKRFGRENFRARSGGRRYRIAPDRWKELETARSPCPGAEDARGDGPGTSEAAGPTAGSDPTPSDRDGDG